MEETVEMLVLSIAIAIIQRLHLLAAVLLVDLAEAAEGQAWRVIGNLPTVISRMLPAETEVTAL